MTRNVILVFAIAAFAAAQNPKQTFIGVITDTMCGADHKPMNVTPETKCVKDCVRMDKKVKYALYDGKNVYALSDQQTPEKFAAQKVKVTGVLFQKTKILQVDTIEAAK
ncbi:MAG: hypothetical protein R2729_03845 [Bryobacteraceae bacterium]